MPLRTGNYWLRALRGRLKSRLRTEVHLGTVEARRYLADRRAEAVTFSDDRGSTVLFGTESPSVSAVLEEFAHVLQHERASFSECDLEEMVCRREIEAKECLVRGQLRFGIPPEENAATLEQLAGYRRLLRDIEAWSS